jgi:molybdate transport system regulatory protein
MKKTLDQKIRILVGSEIAIGPGKAQLLEAIVKRASISAAARELNMSYRRAWMLVDTMNRCFKQLVVTTSAGGARGGGAQLTVFGENVLYCYRRMEARAAACIADDVDELAALMVKQPRP